VSAKPVPTWPLPVLALAQLFVGTVLVSPLRETSAPWSLGYAVLSAVVGLAGLAILGLAVRNCVRLWRLRPSEASWALVAAMLLTALHGALWAAGPTTIGIWRWWSLVPGTFAAFLVIVLVREVRRRLAKSKEPRQLVTS
jgi:hypothetical protein